MKLLIIFVSLFCFSCSTTSRVNTNVVKTFSISETEQDQLEQKFQEVIEYCTVRLNEYEHKAEVQASKAFWMNMSGLVSGAVIVPMIIATGSTGMWPLTFAAGLSGWAGATSFASESLKLSGLSGSSTAQMRNLIVERIRDKATIALDGTKPYADRRNAVLGIMGECTIYPIMVPSVTE